VIASFSVAWPIKQLPLVQRTSFWGAFCVEKPADLLRFSPACGSVDFEIFVCYNFSAHTEGELFAGNDKPDKVAG
jgi:hypothetical protein